MTIKEVNDTYTDWLIAANKLQLVLERNYRPLDTLIALHKSRSEAAKKNLANLQIEALREENKLKQIEKDEQQIMLAEKKSKDDKGDAPRQPRIAVQVRWTLLAASFEWQPRTTTFGSVLLR